jgi:hypothetical protein
MRKEVVATINAGRSGGASAIKLETRTALPRPDQMVLLAPGG